MKDIIEEKCIEYARVIGECVPRKMVLARNSINWFRDTLTAIADEAKRETAHNTSLDALKFMNQEYKDGITGEELTKTMVRYLTNVAINNDPLITNEDNLK